MGLYNYTDLNEDQLDYLEHKVYNSGIMQGTFYRVMTTMIDLRGKDKVKPDKYNLMTG